MRFKPDSNNRASSPYYFTAFVLAVLGFASVAIALSSPYWLVSKPNSDSKFVRLGLWNVCFRDYRHPSPKFDNVFDGCYSLFGHKSQGIRNWLQPGWFVLVQCLMPCGGMLAMLSVGLLFYSICPLTIATRIFVSIFGFVLQALSGLVVFLGACVFGAMGFERSWIQYPKSNSLSWGYGFAVIAAVLHSCAAACLLVHTFRMRKLMYRDNIIYHIPIANKYDTQF